MAYLESLLHTLWWLLFGTWSLYQLKYEIWKLFTWISGQKSFWRSFDSVFFKYNTLTLTSKIALIGQFWSPTTPLKMKKIKKNSKFLGLTLKPSISEKISIVGQKKCFFEKLKAPKHLIWNGVFTKINVPQNGHIDLKPTSQCRFEPCQQTHNKKSLHLLF